MQKQEVGFESKTELFYTSGRPEEGAVGLPGFSNSLCDPPLQIGGPWVPTVQHPPQLQTPALHTVRTLKTREH